MPGTFYYVVVTYFLVESFVVVVVVVVLCIILEESLMCIFELSDMLFMLESPMLLVEFIICDESATFVESVLVVVSLLLLQATNAPAITTIDKNFFIVLFGFS